MDQNRENLTELFGRFVDPNEAAKAADDILAGEQILRDSPAPAPGPELLSELKSLIAARLERRRRWRRRELIASLLAVAAAVVIVAGTWLGRDDRPAANDRQTATVVSTPIIAAGLWDSDDVSADDLALASFSAEVERIENELKSLLTGETPDSGTDIEDIEREFREIEGEF